MLPKRWTRMLANSPSPRNGAGHRVRSGHHLRAHHPERRCGRRSGGWRFPSRSQTRQHHPIRSRATVPFRRPFSLRTKCPDLPKHGRRFSMRSGSEEARGAWGAFKPTPRAGQRRAFSTQVSRSADSDEKRIRRRVNLPCFGRLMGSLRAPDTTAQMLGATSVSGA
jgi:hypothetical protein